MAVFSQDKKIGKAWYLLVLFWATWIRAADQVFLSLESTQGLSLASVSVGKPFTVKVTVKNGAALKALPQIDGLHNFHVRGHTSRTMSMNNNGVTEQETAVLYTVIADTPGTFVIGPARVNGLSSERVTIDVTEAPVSQKKGSFMEPRFMFKTDITEAYVGEKIPFTLSFSWQEPELKPVHFEMPHFKEAEVRNMSRGQARTERKGDQVFNVIEFKGTLYPEGAGMLRIPPLRADFTLPSKDKGWPSFIALVLEQQESVFSQPVKITIKELPPTDALVAGVGLITRFVATLSTSQVPRGEATTLTLSAYGDADFSHFKPPALEAPSSFKQYPSKTSYDAQGGVQWSYVLQGLEEGTFTIPAQKLTYFDLKTKAYKTLRTKPLSITVTPGERQIIARTVTPEIEDDIHEQEHELPPVSSLPMKIPHVLFIVLMLIPPCLAIGRFILRIIAPYVVVFLKKRRALKALKAGKKQVVHLEKVNDVSQLYQTIKHALGSYLGLDNPQDTTLLEALRERGCSKEVCSMVAELLHDTASVSSYADHPLNFDRTDLFQRARNVFKAVKCGLFLLCLIAVGSMQAAPFEHVQLYMSAAAHQVPFIVLQSGVILGWWLLWWCFYRRSLQLKKFTVLALWVFVATLWAFEVPHELYPTVRISHEAPLFVGPSENYPSRGVLKKHDEIVLVKKEGGWYYVSSLQGKGWIPVAVIDTGDGLKGT